MDRNTVLKAIRFERPDYIPMRFSVSGACFHSYPLEELFELLESHPMLCPGFVRPKLPITEEFYHPITRKDRPFVDDFGCIWETTIDGINGTVTKHPLDDWSKWDTYSFPDPSKCIGWGAIDWEKERGRVSRMKERGELVWKGLRHGHTFLQICDMRGYEEIIFDMEDEEPKLRDLLDKLLAYNEYIIQQYVDMGVDVIAYAEDLGMQYGPMLSPQNFRKYILPCYKKLIQPAKDKGINVHMHSDGDIRLLTSMLMECGVQIFNLQDLVNGIDWIKENLKGKVCIDLDIDRQKITPYGTPAEIDKLILEEVKQLGSKQGGLMMVYGLYPGVPLENAKAVMDAMEKYAFYYS